MNAAMAKPRKYVEIAIDLHSKAGRMCAYAEALERATDDAAQDVELAMSPEFQDYIEQLVAEVRTRSNTIYEVLRRFHGR